ncbi:MAG: hypothetical protein R2852_01695 [Bacteroidia bacterium]
MPLTFDKLGYLSDLNSSTLDLNYISYQKDSLFGIMRYDGKVVTDAKYKEVYTVEIDRRYKN